MLLLVGGCGGCGGDAPEVTPIADGGQPVTTVPDTEEGNPGDEALSADNGETGNGASQEDDLGSTEDGHAENGEGDQAENEPGTADETPTEEAPKRPEDVSLWKTKDYLSAKRDGDRQLGKAVAYVGSNPAFVGKDAVAKVMVSLLLTIDDLPEDTDGNNQPVRIQVDRTTALTIIETLGQLRSERSTQTFVELIQGKLEIPLQGSVCIPALFRAISPYIAEYPPYEEMLFSAITQPRELMKGNSVTIGGQVYTASNLQLDAIGALPEEQGEDLRVRLAKFLEDPNVLQQTASLIEPPLLQSKMFNLPAQIVLYKNAYTSEQNKQRIEGELVHTATRSLELILGIPPTLEFPPAPGTVSRPTVRKTDPDAGRADQFFQFADQLWTPEFNAFLNGKMARYDTPLQAPAILSLVASSPLPVSRFAMNELLGYHAHEGPNAWRQAGITNRATCDPAFLVLAKMIYQSASNRRPTVIDPDDMKKRVSNAKQDEWAAEVQPMAMGWLQRMYSASRQAAPGDPRLVRPDEDQLSVKLHNGANIVTEYHVIWPDHVEPEVIRAKIAPLKLNYFRVEEEGHPEDLITRYKRWGGRGYNQPRELRNGYWIDGLVNGSAPNTKRSIDIFITGKDFNPKVRTPAGQEVKSMPIVLEILTIEVPEPSDKG